MMLYLSLDCDSEKFEQKMKLLPGLTYKENLMDLI